MTTTEITTTKNHALATTNDVDPFLTYADAVSPKHILGDLLKFNKGDFLAGETAETIPVGTKVTVGMDLLLIGWVRWENGKPIEHRMVRVADGQSPQRRAELGDDDRSTWEIDTQGKPRDPWALTQYVPMVDEAGDIFTFCTTSRGGINALADLSRYHGRNRRAHVDEFPVVELQVETLPAQQSAVRPHQGAGAQVRRLAAGGHVLESCRYGSASRRTERFRQQ